MNTKPMLFSGEMVRALLEGRKTQTRRVCKLPDLCMRRFDKGTSTPGTLGELLRLGHLADVISLCPYGQPGDLLWVRETWQTWVEFDKTAPKDLPVGCTIQYPATYDGWVSKQRPSIHMPRWASRLTLKLTDVRVQRVQEISGPDCCAEGIQFARINDGPPMHGNQWNQNKEQFAHLWDSINEKRGYSWQSNPYVWALTFEVIRENVDAVIQRLAA